MAVSGQACAAAPHVSRSDYSRPRVSPASRRKRCRGTGARHTLGTPPPACPHRVIPMGPGPCLGLPRGASGREPFRDRAERQ
ncbi:MAG: hypothetical protein MZV70_45465 [Desulfobacterales bacterium]|nr:hypothetical protein [Desulfobacterales bacterium]